LINKIVYHNHFIDNNDYIYFKYLIDAHLVLAIIIYMEKNKEQLEKEREELIRQIEAIESSSNYGDDIDSYDEEADEAEDYATQKAKGSELRARLVEVEEALARLSNKE